MTRLIADCHLHSNTSVDAADSIDAMCRTAIERELQIVCFCNHYEIFPGRDTVQEFIFDFDAYSEEIEGARDKYGDRLQILKGVEFGQPQLHPKEYEWMLAQDFDMIMVSLHFVPAEFGLHWLWVPESEFQHEAEKYMAEVYFEQMRRIIEVDGFDVLAHCDWLRRCYPESGAFKEANADIIDTLVAKGKHLEINTNAYRNGLSEPYPNNFVLERYLQAGGCEVTVGSDAHQKEDIGADFDLATKVLRQHGLKQGYFKKRCFYPLP